MPWHVPEQPIFNYGNYTIHVDGNVLPTFSDTPSAVTISNIGVNKFRSLLRQKQRNTDLTLIHLLHINSITSCSRLQDLSPALYSAVPKAFPPSLDTLLSRFNTLFRNDPQAGLPPKRPVDHQIDITPDHSPPHRTLFQIAPAELIATRQYVTELLKKGKFRPSRSPYGAPLFFVKQKDKLRGVIDSRALNRITKRGHAPIPRTDEPFDRLDRATVFSKLDLKADFHQMCVRSSDVEKTAFKTKYGILNF